MRDSSNFVHRSLFPCNHQELFEWHKRLGALERLIPPWERTHVVKRTGGIEPGGQVVMKMHAGFIPFTWNAEHVELSEGEMFRDIMSKGPFSSWSHSHFFSSNDNGSVLEDNIDYALPLHRYLPGFLKSHVHTTLKRTFQHREKLLREDLDLHASLNLAPRKVLISGASGVLGKALVPLLTTGGHEVYTLVRRAPNREKNEFYWDPMKGEIDDLPFVDAVIHLAGEYIGLGRWTEEKKRRVIESRTRGTSLLAEKVSRAKKKPEVFLCASAVGFYGDTGSNVITEESSAGTDFISDVCRIWEDSADIAKRAGIRTVLMRIGVSLSPGGGALQRLLSTDPIGFFRRFGSGDQYISWISMDDTISAMLHAMGTETLSGPLNMAAPYPVTNTTLLATLAEVMKRPLLFPIPKNLLEVIYGQMATEILLSGCRVSSDKLIESGFRFRHEKLHDALKAMLGKFELKS